MTSEESSFGFATTSVDCPVGKCYGTNTISVFSKSASTGELQLVRVYPVGELTSGAIAVDDTGRYLYSSPYYGVKAYSIAPDGQISQLPDSPFVSIWGQVYKDPNYNRFFAIGVDQNIWNISDVTAFVPGDDGKPVITGGPVSFTGFVPWAATVDPAGNYLFVLDGSKQLGSVHVFSVKSGLSEVEGSPFSITVNATSLAIDPSGTWIYCNSRGDRWGIAQYLIDRNTGRVGDEVSFVPLQEANSIAFDKQGHFLIAKDFSTIYVFKFDPQNGALQLVNKTSL